MGLLSSSLCVVSHTYSMYSALLMHFQFAFPCGGRWRGWRRWGQKNPWSHGQRSVKGTEGRPGHGETHHVEPGWGGRPGWNLHPQVGGHLLSTGYFLCLTLFLLTRVFLHLKTGNAVIRWCCMTWLSMCSTHAVGMQLSSCVCSSESRGDPWPGPVSWPSAAVCPSVLLDTKP